VQANDEYTFKNWLRRQGQGLEPQRQDQGLEPQEQGHAMLSLRCLEAEDMSSRTLTLPCLQYRQYLKTTKR